MRGTLASNEKLDKIRINKRDDIGNIIYWADRTGELINFSTADFPLKRAAIQIEYPRAEITFDVNGKYITIVLSYYGNHYLTFLWNTKADKNEDNIQILHIQEPEKWKQEQVDKYVRECCLTVDCLMFYMANFRERVEVKNKMTGQQPSTKKGKKKKNKNRVVKIGTYYVSPPTKEDLLPQSDKRTYNREAEAWTVRGHWRTYKSGKQVWIKPQVRGDKRGEVKPTTYTI